MSDMNIFKRKTIVIDDDENMEIDILTLSKNVQEKKDFNSLISKNIEENKSNITNSNAIKSLNTAKLENVNKEKKDLKQSSNVIKSSEIENITKQKSREHRDAHNKSEEKNKFNLEKQNPIDKIKKAIQSSSLPDKNKSVALEKEVS